ncbi:hypothetical protein DIJ64_07015 [Mycobacterium leprae]|uniref:Uncharacterized protein n=1 Tax=Mycobacterium leprae TaxID=1769 RepID=A0AAD0KSJ1_MYCLR|nr:hypothetical protein DIJ64_07015 [Mycobacterium leprae]
MVYRTYRIIGREVFAVVNKQLAVVKMPRWSSMTQGSAVSGGLSARATSDRPTRNRQSSITILIAPPVGSAVGGSDRGTQPGTSSYTS